MDPPGQSFTPYSSGNESWRLREDVLRMQQMQTEHAERITRLERRQDEDARLKSVWGTGSPFPSVLSGTPQQAPLPNPSTDQFRNFDDEANNLMSSLHLDAEEEPRRNMAATSRANSVRFDETANQNHFTHSSRPSFDLLSRTSSGLGGIQMTERTTSHKSEGRASSAHSIRSGASGRANSLNMESNYRLSDHDRSPLDTPGFAPALMLLGTVPAIIRCWMSSNFRHDALLYAAICSGSYKSYLDLSLIHKLGFQEVIRAGHDGSRTVNLPVFFPEAITHPTPSRSGSPAPNVPSIMVDFCVIENTPPSEVSNPIQIFIGSDVLQTHNADILFSSNTLTLFDRERNKLSIPLNRPENENTFNGLTVTSAERATDVGPAKQLDFIKESSFLDGLGQGSSAASASSAAPSPPPGIYRPPGTIVTDNGAANVKLGDPGSESDARPSSRMSTASRPSLSLINTRSEAQVPPSDNAPQTTALRSGSSPAIWSNWRREGTTSSANTTSSPAGGGLDWASASKTRGLPYQRKETGIKVLKPKTASRAFSATAAGAAVAAATTATTTGGSSPATDGKSRFFDEGRRRNSGSENITPATKPLAVDVKKENTLSSSSSQASAGSSAPKTKANPIGGASAFSWLNPGGTK